MPAKSFRMAMRINEALKKLKLILPKGTHAH